LLDDIRKLTLHMKFLQSLQRNYLVHLFVIMNVHCSHVVVRQLTNRSIEIQIYQARSILHLQ